MAEMGGIRAGYPVVDMDFLIMVESFPGPSFKICEILTVAACEPQEFGLEAIRGLRPQNR
jgi:hypothetical protein